MKRFVSSLLTLGMLLTPSLSLAEFTRPSELFMLMADTGMPVGFSGELHGNVDEYWFSAWISGSSKGTNGANALANVKGTVDVSMKGGMVRVKFQMRVVDGAAYFYVDSIDGSYEDALWKSGMNIKTKTWIKVELPADLSMEPVEADYTMIDEILHLTSTVTSTGTSYELSLTREAVRDILKNMRDMEYSQWSDALSALPRTAKFSMTVNTNKADAFTSTSGSMEMGSKKMTFSAKGSAWLLSSLSVAAPANSMSMEEWTTGLMSAFGVSGPFDMLNHNDDMQQWEEEWGEPAEDIDWDEYYENWSDGDPSSNWEDDGDTGVDVIPEGDCRLDADAIRHGLCDTFERTPRRLP